MQTGKAKNLIEKFKRSTDLMGQLESVKSERVMVDEVAAFWTVVVETEVEDLAKFGETMKQYGSRTDIQEAMSGYMDLVDGGYREIFRIV